MSTAEQNTAEQELLEKWHRLPWQQQQEVLNFAEFLVQKMQHQNPEQLEQLPPQPTQQPQLPLGERLRELRAKIIASGEQLLTVAELEQEMASQRDRLGAMDE